MGRAGILMLQMGAAGCSGWCWVQVDAAGPWVLVARPAAGHTDGPAHMIRFKVAHLVEPRCPVAVLVQVAVEVL